MLYPDQEEYTVPGDAILDDFQTILTQMMHLRHKDENDVSMECTTIDLRSLTDKYQHLYFHDPRHSCPSIVLYFHDRISSFSLGYRHCTATLSLHNRHRQPFFDDENNNPPPPLLILPIISYPSIVPILFMIVGREKCPLRYFKGRIPLDLWSWPGLIEMRRSATTTAPMKNHHVKVPPMPFPMRPIRIKQDFMRP